MSEYIFFRFSDNVIQWNVIIMIKIHKVNLILNVDENAKRVQTENYGYYCPISATPKQGGEAGHSKPDYIWTSIYIQTCC